MSVVMIENTSDRGYSVHRAQHLCVLWRPHDVFEADEWAREERNSYSSKIKLIVVQYYNCVYFSYHHDKFYVSLTLIVRIVLCTKQYRMYPKAALLKL